MLTLYVDMWSLTHDFVRPNYELVRDADGYFNQRVYGGEIKLEDTERFVELLSSERGELKRPIDMLKLSTSCKTLVLADKYPNLILSNQNISAEASLLILSLFSDSDRAFLYYPARQTLKFSLLVGSMGCHDEPHNILNFDDEITATVVRGSVKMVCNTYGEILWVLDEMTDLSDVSSYTTEKEEDGSYLIGGDGFRLCKGTKPSLLRCDKEGCPFRVQRSMNGFILGGQFICRPIYDGDLNQILEMGSPFSKKPTSDQLDEMFDYAYENGIIKIENEEPSEILYSDVIVDNLSLNQPDNQVVGYYEMSDGNPQITEVFLVDSSKLEVMDFSRPKADEVFGYDEEDMTVDVLEEEMVNDEPTVYTEDGFDIEELEDDVF